MFHLFLAYLIPPSKRPIAMWMGRRFRWRPVGATPTLRRRCIFPIVFPGGSGTLLPCGRRRVSPGCSSLALEIVSSFDFPRYVAEILHSYGESPRKETAHPTQALRLPCPFCFWPLVPRKNEVLGCGLQYLPIRTPFRHSLNNTPNIILKVSCRQK